MNFFLTDIPNREKKPREHGLTMMMDKGLSINDTKNFINMTDGSSGRLFGSFFIFYLKYIFGCKIQ